MKKLVLSIILLLCGALLPGQAPQKFNYQAVIRDASGIIRADANVAIQISLLQGSAMGTAVYIENHVTKTNSFGLVNLVLGDGSIDVGSMAAVDWASGPWFLRVRVDGIEYGTTQILSVPYALYSEKAGNAFSGAWEDLSGRPGFAIVATSGSYNDLLNRPTLFDGSWASLTGKPSLAAVATSGSFGDLLSKPTTLAGYGITDADNSTTNEIQVLGLSGNDLSLSNGGGSVTLPSYTGDNWGSQSVVTDATLSGNGLAGAPLKIAQEGAANGQVLKWNGTTWLPGTDLLGSSLWTQNGDNIFYNGGKVGIGTDPGSDLRQFQVIAETNAAIAAENTSTIYPAMYVRNNIAGGMAAQFVNVSGPVVRFGRNIAINDGTEDEGKILRCNALGETSWIDPPKSPWSASGNDIYYSAGKVGVGGLNTSSAPFRVKTAGSEIARFESDATSSWISLYNSGTRKGILWLTWNTLNLMSDDGGMSFKTNGNNERMAIEDDGDITTPQTGPDVNIMPVAYGYVNSTGTLLTGKSTRNVTSTRNGTAGSYEYVVTIEGVTTNFIALVTGSSVYPNFPGVSYSGNTFIVEFMNTSGASGQANNFSFVVFEP